MREIKTKRYTFEVGEVVKINGDVVVTKDDCCGCGVCAFDENDSCCDSIDCDNIIFKKIKTKTITPIDIPNGELFELKGMVFRVKMWGPCHFGPCSDCQVKNFLACSNADRSDCKLVVFELME